MVNTSLAGKKILYVEDDEASRYLMGYMAEEIGCGLVTCSNGEQAIDKIRTEKFDIIFMDVRMSRMNGYETSRMIRQMDKEIPIIALTAHVMEWVPLKCREAGMNGFVPKPCSVASIEKELCRCLL
ncbi:MAG: response regulator [Candidatus Omnitrophica bacterium]|nr:response regulator [Candidatus Omnitrophota bacterium]